jgi:hypothetical protein
LPPAPGSCQSLTSTRCAPGPTACAAQHSM